MNSNTFSRTFAFVLALVAACACLGISGSLQPGRAYAATPSKVKIAKASSPAAGQIYVKVKKAKRAKGYQYMVSTAKKFDKAANYSIKTVKVKKKTFATIEGLEEGLTYYVKVRAYKGKKYGKWSKAKKVRVLTGEDEAAEALAQANADVLKYKADAEESIRNLISANTKLSEAQGQNEQLQADLDNALTKADEAESSVKQIAQTLEATNMQLAAAKTRADNAETENEALANKNTELTNENTKLTDANAALANENTKLTGENSELTSKNTELAKSNKSLTNENAQVKEDLEAEQTKTGNLQSKVDELQVELAGTGTVEALKGQAEELKGVLQSNGEQLINLKSTVENTVLYEEWKAIASKVDFAQLDLHSLVEDVEAAASAAGEDADTTKASAKLEARVSALQATAAGLAAECDALKAKADNAGELAKANSENKELKEEVDTLSEKVGELNSQIDALESELAGSGATVADLTASVTASANALNGTDETSGLESRIQAIKDAFGKADGILTDQAKAALSTQIDALETSLKAAQADLEAAQNALKDALEGASESSTANAKQEALVTALSAKVSSLEANCTALEADLEAKTQSSLVAGLQSQLNEARSMIPATITYNLGGGTVPEGITLVEQLRTGDAAITLPAIVREGGKFAGWHAYANGAKVSVDSLEYKNGTVYAVHEGQQVDITEQTSAGIGATVYADWLGDGIYYAYVKIDGSDLYELLIGSGNNVPGNGDTYSDSASGKSGKVEWVGNEVNKKFSVGGVTVLGSGKGIGLDLIKLEDIDLSKSTYLDLSNIDVSNETSFKEMFAKNTAIETLILDNWDTSKVTDMSSMFLGCDNLKTVSMKGWNTSQVTKMDQMFSNCRSLETVDVSSFDTRNVVSMEQMFLNCEKLVSTEAQPLDLSRFNTSNLSNAGSMFSGCSSLEALNLENFVGPSVTAVTGMFARCEKLKTVDISGWDMSYVSGNMGGYDSKINMMFNDCKSLMKITAKSSASKPFKLPQNSSSFFEGLSALKAIDGIENWDTSQVKTMSGMFSGCTVLGSATASNPDTNSLSLDNWDTSNVSRMSSMFNGCAALKYMDFTKFSNFTTANVDSFDRMFFGCSNLEMLSLGENGVEGGFDTSKATNLYNMFGNCSGLKKLSFGPEWKNLTNNAAYFSKAMSAMSGDNKGSTYTSNHTIPDGAGIYLSN